MAEPCLLTLLQNPRPDSYPLAYGLARMSPLSIVDAQVVLPYLARAIALQDTRWLDVLERILEHN
jgi:hypothetical protein